MTDEPVLQILQGVTRAAPAGAGKRQPVASAFAVEGELPLAALVVEVQGVGRLGTTLSNPQAQALHAASTPAPHGQRQRTVLDTRVRHTGEVAAAQVALHWAEGALAALQSQVALGLGLGRDGVQARLHSLLVYGPGQFFKPHQDTEKHAGMVGSLVLVWPSAHIGGELKIRKADTVQLFASQHLQAQALRWCAFYADCRHEVKPVQEGWRVVLTFDLVLPSTPTRQPDAAHPALVQALRELFLLDGEHRCEPWLLLLDHEYTERGLRWPLLKGDDRVHVAALRAAAEVLGLVPQLALAEIHESWSADVPYQGRGRGSSGKPERGELIDENMSLDFWVDAEGHSHKGQSLSVALAHCASFTDDHDDFLVNEEYEGYMGNYGETLDYWYRRAALVLQSPVAAEASRFVTQPKAALAAALKLARDAEQHPALAQRLQLAMPDLTRYARAQGRSVLARYAQLAAVLPPELAATLCTPFAWQHLLPADAPALAQLAAAHGADWLVALLRTWTKELASPAGWGWSSRPAVSICAQFDQQFGDGADELSDDEIGDEIDNGAEAGQVAGAGQAAAAGGLWPHPLPAFIDACRSAQWPPALLDEVVLQALNLQRLSDVRITTPVQRLAAWPTRLRALCDLALGLQRLPEPAAVARHLRALLEHLSTQAHHYPPQNLVPLLQALQSPAALAAAERQALLGHVRGALQAALQTPVPAADDHGLRDMGWTCRCADCTPALRWAESASSLPLTLAMAETRRNHVQQALQAAAAPLLYATVKKGSPHKLVLSKQPGLHAQWQRQRVVWADDLQSLHQAGGPG